MEFTLFDLFDVPHTFCTEVDATGDVAVDVSTGTDVQTVYLTATLEDVEVEVDLHDALGDVEPVDATTLLGAMAAVCSSQETAEELVQTLRDCLHVRGFTVQTRDARAEKVAALAQELLAVLTQD